MVVGRQVPPAHRNLDRRLEDDVFPVVGHKSIDRVRLPIFGSHARGQRRGARDVAKRIHETHRADFPLCHRREIASRNPAADFKPQGYPGRGPDRKFCSCGSKELPELLAKMDDYNGDALTRFATETMAYTFVRTSELIEAPWTEFDLDKARWKFQQSA